MRKQIALLAAWWLMASAGMAQTWEPVTISTSQNLLGVRFVDADHGWIVDLDGRVFRTTNGGDTWTERTQITGQDVYCMDFVDTLRGWIGVDRGTVWHTEDAGGTWTTQATSAPLPVCGVDFVDANHGWAVAGPRILRTTNGGNSWATQSVMMSGMGVCFVDTSNGWAVGSIDAIQHTSDGGSTWAAQSPDVPMSGYRAVTFADANHGWAVGDFDPYGIVVHTTNGGATWTPQNHGTGGQVWDVACVDANRGWLAIENGTILCTTNGGSTWAVQGQTTTGMALRSIYFKDPDHGWATGDAGTVLRYVSAQGARFTTGIGIPETVFLSPAYPNPFNPSTTLKFGLPRATNILLDVSDILGRRTGIVYSGWLNSGEHAFNWTCPNCPSGSYIVNLQAGGQTIHRRILLLK